MGILFSIASYIHWFIAGNLIESFLLKSLFKNEGTEKREMTPTSINEVSQAVRIHRITARTPFSLKKCCNCACLRSKRENRILERGLDRALKELEVDRFIRTQKQVRVLFKTLLTKVERFLLRNNKVFILDSSERGDSSSDDTKADTTTFFEYLIEGRFERGSPHFETLLDGAFKGPKMRHSSTANRDRILTRNIDP